MPEDRLVPVLGRDGKAVRQTSLSFIFKTKIRPELIHRVYVLASSGWYQPKGRDPMAGKRTTAESWGVDRAVSRVPRLSTGRARFAPSVVRGRLAHPPVAQKRLHKKVNRKERLKAILSAISATAIPELVKQRGHRMGQCELPIILDPAAKEISRTSEVKGLLENLGLSEEMMRLEKGTKKRSGVSAVRGRRIKTRVGPLFVVDTPCPLERAATNIAGLRVVNASRLGIKELMPGGKPGRLTLWIEPSIQVVEKRLMNKVVS